MTAARSDPADPLLTVEQVSAQLAIPVWSVRQMIRQRELTAIDIGRGRRSIYRVEPQQLRDYIDARRTHTQRATRANARTAS